MDVLLKRLNSRSGVLLLRKVLVVSREEATQGDECECLSMIWTTDLARLLHELCVSWRKRCFWYSLQTMR